MDRKFEHFEYCDDEPDEPTYYDDNADGEHDLEVRITSNAFDDNEGERRAEEAAERAMVRFWKWREEGLI